MKIDLNSCADALRRGDPDAENEWVRLFEPKIRRLANDRAKIAGWAWNDARRDDLASIGLEAVLKIGRKIAAGAYQEEQAGDHLFGLVSETIFWRLYDHARGETKHAARYNTTAPDELEDVADKRPDNGGDDEADQAATFRAFLFSACRDEIDAEILRGRFDGEPVNVADRTQRDRIRKFAERLRTKAEASPEWQHIVPILKRLLGSPHRRRARQNA
ncbi:MAG: hypothetical protein IT424_09430 [Pirellulales bacterium]|nr:hypothetical protein [Pirellulales bacterium]